MDSVQRRVWFSFTRMILDEDVVVPGLQLDPMLRRGLANRDLALGARAIDNHARSFVYREVRQHRLNRQLRVLHLVEAERGTMAGNQRDGVPIVTLRRRVD